VALALLAHGPLRATVAATSKNAGVNDLRDLLIYAATRAADYRERVAETPVFPSGLPLDALRAALASLPDEPTPAPAVIEELADLVEPALVASTGPRYFGFVIGGALDAATAADVLTTAWDQNAYNALTSPGAAVVEEAAGTRLKDLLGLPADAAFGFVTGAQGANTVCLAAARHGVLAQTSWDVERHGLLGGPRLRVVANAERHATIDHALRLLGLGADMLEPVATDSNGAIDART
jgi:glutamate/tyrosine decarboxylase-like PLP-dependent enzyme